MEYRLLISLLLGALAIWILSPFQPEIPYLNFNDKLIASCQIGASQSTIRLYEGGGKSLTRWDVTIQSPGSAEHDFFRSYDSPAVQSLSCGEGAVTLKSLDSREQELTFTSEQIEQFKGYPMEFSDGKLVELGGKKFPELHHYAAGVLVGLIAWILYRGLRSKPLREVKS